MKKIIVLFLFFLSSGISFPQTGWQNAFYSNANEITSVSKIDSNSIIAFTYYNDECIRSSNSGISWITYKCFDTICTIRDSKFINANTGYCVGYLDNDRPERNNLVDEEYGFNKINR